MTCITCRSAPMKQYLASANEDVFKCNNKDCKTRLKITQGVQEKEFSFIWYKHDDWC